MRQRVSSLALTLCSDQEFDYPRRTDDRTLDVLVQAQIIALIKQLYGERGTSVMLVTHDMGVIARPPSAFARDGCRPRRRDRPGAGSSSGNRSTLYAKGDGRDPRRLPGDNKRSTQIPGSMPRPTASPAAALSIRAARLRLRRCRVERPELISRAVDQAVACHLYDTVPRRARHEQAPFVQATNLRRVFDVSKPWLNRVLEGGHLEYLKAVDRRYLRHQEGQNLQRWPAKSGSGKTTVARMVVGLLPPSSGNLLIDGISMTDPTAAPGAAKTAPPHPDDLSRTPMRASNPRVRVDAIISEPIRAFDLIQGERDIRARVGELLSLVGLIPTTG